MLEGSTMKAFAHAEHHSLELHDFFFSISFFLLCLRNMKENAPKIEFIKRIPKLNLRALRTWDSVERISNSIRQ